jgi:V/A-type H+-transporting ATPase subunit A
VLRARVEGNFHMYESVAVGPHGLPGEIIKLGEQDFVAQVYEDTTGLKPGDLVMGSGKALSIRLGPGILGGIFDGLLRPLTVENGPFIDVRTARRRRSHAFRSTATLGARLGAGAAVGTVNSRPGQTCLVPPGVGGTVEWLAAPGDYFDEDIVCRVRDARGEEQAIPLAHSWPIREARPVRVRLPASAPMVTGQRILDTLFPVARGGRAALPGGFGTGKTVLQGAIARWCDADIIVYVGCGERGNEMADVLDELPNLEDPRSGRALMDRTVIIANTSNMPVAAREASIYTAITVAEYFRDQGLHVALMADSTSRWAEALREVSGRLGELPGEAGYPAYLGSRLAEFYERAGWVETLAGTQGSVTLIGAVSPPAGDFTEPVTMHTRHCVRTFWALDRTRAQARFYPAIDPLQSYSIETEALAHWWRESGNPDWLNQRRRVLGLLENQVHLERMARIVGKDALPSSQQIALLCAELVNDAILRQSSYSVADRYCSPARQTAILKLVLRFVELAELAGAAGRRAEHIAALPIRQVLQRLGEDYDEAKLADIGALGKVMEEEFANLDRETADAG